MVDPGSFMLGVGIGTTSLISNVAFGLLMSSASVVEGATQSVAIGAAYMSGDSKFANERDSKRR